MTKVTVFVLGDIGRSPRMCYHALSLANKPDVTVDLCGIEGATPPKAVLEHPSIRIRHTQEFAWCKSLPAGFIWKVILQSIWCFFLLISSVGSGQYLLVQNPPAIPTLFIAQFVVWLKGARLVIDWHNYAYSIMEVNKVSPRVTRTAKSIEHKYGRGAYHNFSVTKAMKEDLENNWGIRSVSTLYDRPPEKFHEATIAERHDVFSRLAADGQMSFRSLNLPAPADEDDSGNPFTIETASGPALRADRPALVVSSTSWTDDEDFEVLFQAAKACDQMASAKAAKDKRFHFPTIVFAVTGKGPNKARYEKLFASLDCQYVRFVTLWLEAEDYPLLLGAADLGICLHTSSSGLDLPMKVVDMFGCKLPVCAYDYPCLNELVKNNKTGLVFTKSEQLADQIFKLLRSFPDSTDVLDAFRDEIRRTQSVRWDEAWDRTAWPVFQNK